MFVALIIISSISLQCSAGGGVAGGANKDGVISWAEASPDQVKKLSQQQVNLMLTQPGFPYRFLSEKQILEADQGLLDHYFPNIKPCCKEVRSGESRPHDSAIGIIKNSKKNNPYLTAVCSFDSFGKKVLDSPSANLVISEGVDYTYSHPAHLGKPDQIIPFHYFIPSRNEDLMMAVRESDVSYAMRRLKLGYDAISPSVFHNYFDLIAQGAESSVYDILPEVPIPSLVGRVVKLRNLETFGHGADREYSEILARRDLALWSVVEELAQSYRVSHVPSEGSERKWERSIEVVPIENLHLQIGHGIFVQKFSAGKSAYAVARLVHEAEVLHVQSALKELISLGFKDVHAAKMEIALLEEFYNLTHLDVIHFEEDNGLPQLSSRVVGDRECEDKLKAKVGIDFNHGLNVIWSVRDKKWNIIDY